MKHRLEFSVFVKLLVLAMQNFAIFVASNSYLAADSRRGGRVSDECKDPNSSLSQVKDYLYEGQKYNHPDCFFWLSGRERELGSIFLYVLAALATFISIGFQFYVKETNRLFKLVDTIVTLIFGTLFNFIGGGLLITTTQTHELSYYASKDFEVKRDCIKDPDLMYELGFNCEPDEPFTPTRRDTEVTRGKTGYYGKLSGGTVAILCALTNIFIAILLLLSIVIRSKEAGEMFAVGAEDEEGEDGAGPAKKDKDDPDAPTTEDPKSRKSKDSMTASKVSSKKKTKKKSKDTLSKKKSKHNE